MYSFLTDGKTEVHENVGQDLIRLRKDPFTVGMGTGWEDET